MYEYKVEKVLRVVDGDTIDVIINLGFDILVKKRIRLAGIDAPESRTRDLYEKKLGLEAKAWLKEKIGKAEKVFIRTENNNSVGKFGRVLGVLYVKGEDVSLNKQMIDQGYAWEYEGAAKVKDFKILEERRKK